MKPFRSSLTSAALGLCVLTGAPCLPQAVAQPGPNLVPDASFEAPLPAWFSEAGQGSYYAGKEKVQGAAEGSFVLAIAGWEKNGSHVLAPPINLTATSYSATLRVRSFGNVAGATIELALVDEKSTAKLATFGTLPVDGKGQWATIAATGVKLAAPATRGRLAIVVSGPQHGARVETDQVGFFAGDANGAVDDNADFTWFEAEAMDNGKSWVTQNHYATWYEEFPNAMKMLAGTPAVTAADNVPASKVITVRNSGPHRLWMRFMCTDSANHATFSIGIKQGDKLIASKEIDDGDTRYGPVHSWVWTSLDADLAAGEAQVVLTRPTLACSWIARKVDLIALTGMLDYKPEIADYRPKGYIRFTNRSTEQAPYCPWVFVMHMSGPIYYVSPGMMTAAGLNGGYYVPADKEKWLTPGETSPWSRITDYLVPAGNRMTITGTRIMHTDGLLKGQWRGTLEFAVGDERRIVKTIEIDQTSPRITLTVPSDFEANADQIFTPFDYIAKSEAAVAAAGKPHGKVAKHLDLNVILGFDAALDDPRVVEREINVIKSMGFNGTYTPVADPKDAVAYYAAHGLEQHFGMWAGAFLTKNNCINQPDVEGMRKLYQEHAKRFAPILNKVERMKLSDEPSGPPYTHLTTCDVCKTKFKETLKAQGLTPQQLDVASWDEVTPVLPEDREKHRALFYHTGLFRLQSFADLGRASIAIKNELLPANVKTYINYSPPLSEQMTWTQRGNDLFMCQRNGGFELGWTEDWLGYGPSPQQMSPIYAQLRAAGAPTNEPLGGYMVGTSGGPLLQRIKYYEMIANGARHVNVYCYGPHYLTVDSWSQAYTQYAPFIRVQHELGVIDEALHGTTRRKTDVAILYNRTAGIWCVNTTAGEQDSRYLHFALAHAGYDAAYIPEEDIEAGQLSQYKVLYLNGINIRRATATVIAAWVERGGVLYGSAGAGSRDEYDHPLDTLNAVFGATSENLKLERDAGRPKYELRTLAPLDVLTSVAETGAPPVSFNQLCYRETLKPAPTAKVILKNKAGEAAGVHNVYGKGQAIRLAAVPGITYLNDATQLKDYDIETYLPKAYRPELRDFIAWPAMLGKAFRVAHPGSPITEITRYDGKTGNKSRAVFFVIDHNAEPNPNFNVVLPQTGQFSKAYTASGQTVKMKRLPNNTLQVAWPLDVADAIVLE